MSSSSSPETSRRPSVVLLVAAGALVVVVVVLVVVFGVVRPPAVVALADDPRPAPPGGVAWTAWSRDGSCLAVAWPDGRVEEELFCERDGGEVVAWTDDGVVMQTWRGAGAELVTVDPVDGAVVDWSSVEPERDGPFPVGGLVEAVRTERRDGRVVVTHERDRDQVVWEVQAPDAYDITSGARSPDGGWFALVDSAERLLVVPADGSRAPRLWADGVPRWSTIVWRGTEVELGDARG